MSTGVVLEDKGPKKALYAYILKDPNANLDYTFKWQDWLPVGDTISNHSIIVEGVTLVSSQVVGTDVVVWLSAGVEGVTAKVTCRVVTTAGRVDDRTLHVLMVQR